MGQTPAKYSTMKALVINIWFPFHTSGIFQNLSLPPALLCYIYITSFIWLELWIHKHKAIQMLKNGLDTSHPASKITSLLLFLVIATLKILSCIWTYFVCMYTHRGRGMYMPCAHVNIRGQLKSDSSVLLLYWSHGLNTGSETVQAPFPAEPHPHPHSHSSTPPPLHPSTPSLPHLQRPSHFLGFFCSTGLSFIVFFFFWPPGFRIHLPYIVVRFDTCSHPFPPSSSLETSSLAFFLLL